MRLVDLKIAAIVLSFPLAVSCGSKSGKSPTSPSETGNSVAGTWVGSYADNTLGSTSTSWTLQQSGDAVSGSFRLQSQVGPAGQGTVTGTLSGSTLRLTASIPAGVFPPPYQNCSETITATLQIQGSILTGSYTLQLGPGCIPPNYSTSGTFSLTIGSALPTPAADAISLSAVSPASGTVFSPGQVVTISATLAYSLTTADSGSVVLVIQNQSDQSLQPVSQPSRTVARGNGTVTLSQSVTLPASGLSAVRVIGALLPAGSTSTSTTVLSGTYPVR